MVELKSCPLCLGNKLQHFEDAPSNYAAHPVLKYQICRSCGLVFQSPRMDEQEMNRFYEHFFQWIQSGDRTPTAKVLDLQKKKLKHLADWSLDFLKNKPPRRFLDIGCSSGQLMHMVQEAGAKEVVGIEPGSGYRDFAKAKGLTVYASLEELLSTGPQKFDLISLSHVIEHLPNPIEYLIRLRQELLSTDGTLLLEVPNLFEHYSLETAHNFAFSSVTIGKLLVVAGFSIEKEVLHSQPEKHKSRKYITLFAKSNTASSERVPTTFCPVSPLQTKLLRQKGLIQAVPLKNKGRILAGIVKRQITQWMPAN